MLRSFEYDDQWNIIYYPKKPSGFSIFIIGDHHQYVDNQDSFWLQHPGRTQILDQFLDSGYTCFSSNLYGEHWGNDDAVQLAKAIYHLIMKTEILNTEIHLFAEGKGALVALKLMSIMPEHIRAAVFLNPCLSVKQCFDEEKHKKVYFQPFVKSMTKAFGTEESSLQATMDADLGDDADMDVPLKIIHVLEHEQSGKMDSYKKVQKHNKQKTEISYLLPEKRYKIGNEALRFYKAYENVL
ncbi:hydrolase [Bacillus sp. 1P06AnD]|uniref:hydrolase n=1 Tax=Bacillus sp. 1P06AnD TaxID=3132208 RepID=UPI0039A13013